MSFYCNSSLKNHNVTRKKNNTVDPSYKNIEEFRFKRNCVVCEKLFQVNWCALITILQRTSKGLAMIFSQEIWVMTFYYDQA